ncbi:MAG: peptidoglycan editing factor PgeF [Caulobacterales bacterium]
MAAVDRRAALRHPSDMDHPPFIQSNLLQVPSIRHGFFGRQGGASKSIYASLNAGPGSRDAPDAVAENRRRIAAALELSPDRLLSVYQVHSAKAVIAIEPFAGRYEDRPQADAMASNVPDLALSILTADCGPILLADTEAKVIGAAHAGWKGAVGGVLEAAIGAMLELGAQKPRIVAAIGPCIAQASYEVGPEFLAQFTDADEENERFFKGGQGDRLHFDLKGYCAARLQTAGLARVDILPQDTCAEEKSYFSNRRAVKRQEGDYGRNLSAVVLQR